MSGRPPEPRRKYDVIRTLIVDDSEAVRTDLVAFAAWVPRLKVIGTASDGAHALERIAERFPHLVLMDMNLPGTDGLEATRLIRRRHPSTRVILMSIYEGPDIEASCVEAGADAFLSKAKLYARLEPTVTRLFPLEE